MVLTLPKGSLPLEPSKVEDYENGLVAGLTDQGRLLVFPLSELPRMPRGKGVKILNMPKTKRSGEEKLIAAVPLTAKAQLRIHAGKRYLNLGRGDLEPYLGTRAQRGTKLPRGFQNPDRVEIL